MIQGASGQLSGGFPLHRRLRYVNNVSHIPHLSAEERDALGKVEDRYAFRANDYYLNLVNWDDPNDPIRQLIVPRVEELSHRNDLDPGNEAAVTVARGVQHKYPDTVLLLCNEICGGYCRHCFRKRLFMEDSKEAANDVSAGIRYIAHNPNVTNVLLTGGDPLLLSTRRLCEIIEQVRAIPHVRIVRIGSKMPAFDPWRLLGDPKLQEAFRKYSTGHQRIYLMAHFDHPRELTDAAVESINCLIHNGVICANQCPLIRGVNDDAEVLATLFRRLSFIGCPPYYVFQCRPTAGNAPYMVPLVRGWRIFSEALRHGSGLARTARFVMSHETGKIEIAAVDERHIYLRYHRAKGPATSGRFMVFRRDDEAYWLDDLASATGV